MRIGLSGAAWAFAAATTFASTVFAQSSPAVAPPSVQWVQTPSAKLDPLNWPERALRLGRNGEATLRCAHDAAGVLSDCHVVHETPSGYAFGQAAVRMAKAFRLKPTLSDGSALMPGEVTFPVDFNVAEFRDPRFRRNAVGSDPGQWPNSADRDRAQVQWEIGPSARVPYEYWPERALRREVSGEVVLKCLHDAKGMLGDCHILSEAPVEVGFGAAALRLSRRFKLKPTFDDGSPLAPGEITFPVPFRIADVSF